ncbi:putative membrane protein [Synechococcus sp. MIT S9220]|uniref:hypothetical protein n=1 Tax=unclassified Synechococcus TaxID=2626047 RepID=UPI00164C79FF|nr:hypothetical protein [Synechococcus sp. MIT S9220]NOL48089.1 hypothetical protein [Synechococcus sp. MIT S9220]QNJ21471.1 putative membrane protein [Synechococcus sp. MIT S9220]
MLAIIIFTISTIAILTPSTNTNKIEQAIYSIVATSLLISVSAVGLISLLTLSLKLAWAPIWSIGLALLIYIIIYQRHYLYAAIKATKKQILLNASSLKEKSIANALILLLLLLLAITSFGPINHPDAADYHTGYAFQFWLQQRLVIDGGLTEGLLGFGDLSNYSFYQESNGWLIRTMQAINILPAILFLIQRKSNKTLLITFLSLPVFMQWLTIGKPLLLTDISLFVSYATWIDSRTQSNAKLAITCCILSLGFKITSLLIIFPILTHICSANIKYFKKPKVLTRKFTSGFLFIYAFSSITILAIFRYQITGNPMYPLFSKLFTPNDWQKSWFENMLGASNSYPAHFPISLAIPFSIQHIGIVLGPAIVVAVIICLASIKYSAQKSVGIVAIMQITLLIILGPKRADYYATPILLLIYCESYSPINFHQHVRSLGYRLLYFFLLPTQILVFLGLSTLSLLQTSYAILEYESAMNRFAWGFSLYQTIQKNIGNSQYVNLAGRNLRNYSGANYVDKDKFEKCLGNPSRQAQKNQATINKTLPYFNCMKKLNTKYIIAQNNLSENNENLQCHQHMTQKTSRNPFNLRKQIIFICNATKINGQYQDL